MILPSTVLQTRVNQVWEYSGMDSIENCLDRRHFKQYPHNVIYQYNSRGFRDLEWPSTIEELKTAIWCIGDSFTMGLGSPIEHTWPWLLQKRTGQRTINISMDGASNNWIARQTAAIQHAIDPKNIIVMWSYLHRRESANSDHPDELRRIHSNKFNDDLADLVNFKHCKQLINQTGTVVEFSIPEYTAINLDSVNIGWATIRGSSWPVNPPSTIEELTNLPANVQRELQQSFKVWDEYKKDIELAQMLTSLEEKVINVQRLDLARDGHHFDRITAEWIVDRTVDQLTDLKSL